MVESEHTVACAPEIGKILDVVDANLLARFLAAQDNQCPSELSGALTFAGTLAQQLLFELAAVKDVLDAVDVLLLLG